VAFAWLRGDHHEAMTPTTIAQDASHAMDRS